MISLKELMGANNINDIPIAHQQNLSVLLQKLNIVRAAYGLPMTVTSGYRSMQHHIDVYRTKALREGRTFSMLQIPLNSRHLTGNACDFADSDGTLYKWATENVAVLEEAGLWAEKGTSGWLHLQDIPPRSGNRFFNP